MHREMMSAEWRHAPRRAMVLAVLTVAMVTPSAHTQGVRPTQQGVGASAVPGDLEATERRLYDAARRAPRDRAARAALGTWLASRGQLKSGAVLLEEARLFGGDAVAIAARLAPIYTWLRDWASLAALPSSPLAAGEKARAAVLAERTTTVSGADSTVVTFAPLEIGALGRLPLVLAGDTVWSEVDPQETGIVLPGLGRGGGVLEILGNDRRGPLGVVAELQVGEITLRNVPVRIDALLGAGRARLGFDVFALLAPTVDARAGTATFRRTGQVDEPLGAVGVPFVLGFPGVLLALRAGEAPAPMTSPAGRAGLRGRPWTVDLRRGVIWVDAGR